MAILQSLRDRHLFGTLPAFRDLGTWSAWRSFLAAVYGLPMSEAELATFRGHTARSAPRPGGYSEAVAIVGTQSGKTRLAGVPRCRRSGRVRGRGAPGADSGRRRALLGFCRSERRREGRLHGGDRTPSGERIVVDCVRAWVPPFNPTGVVAEAAELLEAYHCNEVTGDRYAGEWPRQAFRAHNVEYEISELDRSRLYLELLPVANAGTVELPNDTKLLAELRGLERRRGTAGRDRVDHRPGSHDDRANAVAGVVYVTSAKNSYDNPQRHGRQADGSWYRGDPSHHGKPPVCAAMVRNEQCNAE
jgi:hypothetical protein